MAAPTASEGVAQTDRHPGGEPESVRLGLLGGFRVSVGSRTIAESEWRLKKAANLLKVLALAPNHRMHRERVMDLLWPGLGLKAATNNLRQVLYNARRVLEPIPTVASCYLDLLDEQLALCPDGHLWVDVETFEQAAATARRACEPAAYRTALELYAGDLLPGDLYEEWAEGRREELRRLRLALLIEMSGLCEERGDLESAVKVLQEVLSNEPANEEAHAGLMRVYAGDGQRFQALRQYHSLRETLQRELATEPEQATRRLYEDIVAGRLPPARTSARDLPPREPLSAGRHNLPAALSSFVGREREMVEARRALAMTRLLTLTGAGGCGKTRLALEVVGDLAGSYPDGAWLVELAPLSDPELLPQEVASALEVRERPDHPLISTLVDALRTKEMVLMMDNCEHLVEGCAHLVERLLVSCPGLRVLATSREALGVSGEVNWVVPSLTLPEAGHSAGVEELGGVESVRLFVERAGYRRPAFTLSAHNAPVVAEICRRVEGIPLAIEFAAARVGTMSVEQISERLEDSLGLLSGGSRTATPRQRTLRGALEWSHRLLSGPEQELFGRLSVFAGGWTLEASEAVGSGGSIEEGEVLDLLSHLVDKSLVVAEPTGEGGVRHRMLEPVRQYAREWLVASGEAEEWLHRHAEYYLAEAEAAEAELTGPHQRWWLDRLEAEHDNLRAALGWSLEGGEEELGLRLGGALGRFWYMRGYLSEGRRWLEEGLAGSGAASAPVRAKALDEAGWIAEAQGDYERAGAAYEESLELYRSLGDERGIARSSGNLGSVALFRGNSEQAAALFESLAVVRELGNERDVFRVLTDLGTLAFSRDDQARAVTLFEEALAVVRKAGDAQGTAIALANLGFTELLQDDRERATSLLEESLTLYREVGDRRGIAGCLINLGLVALFRGDHKRATALLGESLTILQEVRDKESTAECLEAMAGVAGARGEAERTAQLWGASQALREDIGAPLLPDERAILEPYLAPARSRLEEEAWETEQAQGRAIELEEAIEYALSEEKLAPAPEKPSAGRQSATLTPREQEVAVMVARGMTNRQIAADLVISEGTVANHVARLLRKVGLHSRAQVAAWMVEEHPLALNPE